MQSNSICDLYFFTDAIDDLDSRVTEFLSNGATATEEWKEENYRNLKQEYSKAVEDAEEKVNIATQIYDLVDRHLRKLDQELSKFKMELEADNAGITEILEQRRKYSLLHLLKFFISSLSIAGMLTLNPFFFHHRFIIAR